MLNNELIKLDDRFITWGWIYPGLEFANSVGIRRGLDILKD